MTLSSTRRLQKLQHHIQVAKKGNTECEEYTQFQVISLDRSIAQDTPRQFHTEGTQCHERECVCEIEGYRWKEEEAGVKQSESAPMNNARCNTT